MRNEEEETLERPLDLPGERTQVSSPPEMMVLDQPPGRDTIPTAFPGIGWSERCEAYDQSQFEDPPEDIPEEIDEDYDEECTTAGFARPGPGRSSDDIVSMTFPHLDDDEPTKENCTEVSSRTRARARAHCWQHWPWIVIVLSLATTAVSLGGLLWV